MSTSGPVTDGQNRRKIASRKVVSISGDPEEADDSLTVWAQRYLDLAVRAYAPPKSPGRSPGT
jgi:hypothetical protein